MREETPTEGNSRRTVLAGAGVVGLAGVLAACGGSSASNGSSASSSSSGGAAGGDPSQGAGGGANALAKTSDIPVGGGKIFADQKVVVTQPVAGEFKAFSAICQHMGCTVGTVEGGTINCPCHGSKYAIADAKVVAGPSPRPLPPKTIKVTNGEITLS